jgi:hypothetical protein
MAEGKFDLYKIYKDEYIAPSSPRLVRHLSGRYLTISGRGARDGETFVSATKALYDVALSLRMEKKMQGKDYVVCKLEGMWWGRRDGTTFLNEPPERRNWRLLLRVPRFVTEEDRLQTVMGLIEKGGDPFLGEVQRETLRKGLCVQMLHAGPYDTEIETLDKMQAFVEEEGMGFYGRLHEIYLTDPKRVQPADLQTILRFPVR